MAIKDAAKRRPPSQYTRSEFFFVLYAGLCLFSHCIVFGSKSIPCPNGIKPDRPGEEGRISPCKYSTDPQYTDGLIVHCSNLGLQTLNSSWFPSSTIQILLDWNNIDQLDDTTFENAKQLRRLSIAHNRLTIIRPRVFNGVSHLEYLDMEFNSLYLDLQSSDLFSNLRKLTTLKLGYNKNINSSSHQVYPENLLKGLNKLRYLSLHTFEKPLEFGNLFKDAKSLNHLLLTGDVTEIRNDSFRGFEGIPLESLFLNNVRNLNKTEFNAVENLNHLQSYSLDDTIQGLEKTLLSLCPFQNRNMTSLIFKDLTADKTLNFIMKHGPILDVHKSKYLSRICVKHFRLIHTRIFYIEPGTITTDTWHRCLQSIELTSVPILGEISTFYQIFQLRSLKSLIIQECYSMFQRICLYDKRSTHRGLENMKYDRKLLETEQSGEYRKLLETEQSGEYWNVTSTILNLPPNLENFTLARCGGIHQLTGSILFKHAKHIRNVIVYDIQLNEFTAKITGLTNVEYLDLSYNKIQSMTSSVFDAFLSLKNLKLKSMNLNESYDFARLFRNLENLEIVDLSSNDLNWMQPNAFQMNRKLKEIDLSDNKLSSLTVDLSALNQLHRLNLKHNSINYLLNSEIQSLEQLRKRSGNLSIYLDGNLLSCDCSNFHFLSWINSTLIYLDNKRDYRCLGEDGHSRTTSSLIKDLDAMWRHCHGLQAFLIALVLWLLVILSLISGFCITHFKTLIRNTMLTMFIPNLKLQSRETYRYAVYLGYSNADYRFACFDLRRFLEDRLKVTTYIRDRDLLPAENMAKSIIEAINSSWRVLFIITNDFLRLDDWLYFALKAAVYSVNPLNPKKVIIIADVGIVNQIPEELLQVVPDDNIIEMEMPFKLMYEEFETLKNVIL